MPAVAETRALAAGPDASRLQEFYVVGAGESDFFPYWVTTILHVRPHQTGSSARYVLINGATQLCGRPEILAAEKLLEGVGIQELLGRVDVCSLDPDEIARTVKSHRRDPAMWETSREALVAQCGDQEKAFHLPTYKMDLASLAKAAPDVYALTRVGDTALEKTFPDARGGDWVQEYLSEDTGAALVNDIRSGRYDSGYWHCVEGMHPGLPAQVVDRVDPSFGSGCDREKLHNLLGRYIDPSNVVFEGRVVLIRDRETPRFSEYVSPVYPPEAIRDRAYGTVRVEFSANPATRSVERVNVSILRAHLEVVREATLKAARRWRLDRGQDLRKSFRVQLRFLLECKPRH